VPLGLAVETETAAPTHHVHVALGTVHVLASGEYVTATTTAARRYTEYYALETLARIIVPPQRPFDEARLDAWSFIAFCIACGNDYVRRPKGISHAVLFAAYTTTFRERRLVATSLGPATLPAVARAPVVDPRALAYLVRCAVYARLSEAKRPVSWDADVPTYAALAAVTSMPTHDELLAYYDGVCWSLLYAALGVEGIEHVSTLDSP